MTIELFGYPITERPLDRLVNQVVDHVSRGAPPLKLFAMNPTKVALAEREGRLACALNRAEVLYPDGLGICLAARLIHGRTLARVPGVELATALVDEAAKRGWTVYLLGARRDVNEEVARTLESRFPELRIVGRHHGYFDSDEEAVVDEVRSNEPDLLLVALGTPRQEIWIDRHCDRLGAKVLMGVGGTFDVYAGRVRRAPVIFQRAGLEWLYRIAVEPRRLPRFARTQPRFFAMVTKHMVARRLA